MTQLPLSLNLLVEAISKMPSIGDKTARRLAYFMLNKHRYPQELAQAILEAQKNTTFCEECFTFCECNNCLFCNSTTRNQQVICIVEEPQNVYNIEGSGEFQGVYHVLQGALAPINGFTPDKLRIKELEKRVQIGTIQELILATNPTIEGDATSIYLTRLFKDKINKITCLARGIPTGTYLEYSDSFTLSKALENRTSLK